MQTEMEFSTGRQFIARFLPGEDLIASLEKFCKKHSITSAYIPMLLGAVKNVKLYQIDADNKPIEKIYKGPLELTAQGTIAMSNGKCSPHIHAVAGSESDNASAIMGHFMSGTIHILTEIIIIELLDVDMIRDIDEKIFSAPVLFLQPKKK